MIQGKFKRYRRSMKNVIKLQNYYSPSELELSITEFVEYDNNQRYHESIDILKLAHVYFGRSEERLTKREQIKMNTLDWRGRLNQPAPGLLYNSS